MPTNYYVRPGATGDNDGRDWNHAFTAIPGTLVRDSIYYLADGAYTVADFTTAASGTDWIELRKATEADHGTETGWDSSYGDGQAAFTPDSGVIDVFRIRTDYIRINGNWSNLFGDDETDYGITIRGGLDYSIMFSNKGGSAPSMVDIDNVQIEHCFIARGNNDPHSDPVAGTGEWGFDATAWTGSANPTISNVLISRCYLGGHYVLMNLANFNDSVIEFCRLHDSASSAGSHSSQIRLENCDNLDIRYNWFDDPFSDGGGATGVLTFYGGPFNNIRVYGNVFSRPDGRTGGLGSGWITTTSSDSPTITGLAVHNNVFINSPNGNIIRPQDSATLAGTVVAYNNLFYKTVGGVLPSWHSGMTHDYSLHIDPTGTNGEASGQAGGTSDPFVDRANGNFALTAETVAGLVLASPFDEDLLGSVRGGDGTWTRGAIEYVDGGPPPPPLPEDGFGAMDRYCDTALSSEL